MVKSKVADKTPRIVLLCSPGDSSRAVYRALKEKFDEVTVIMEASIPRLDFLRRRLKRLGLVEVFGQVLFMSLVAPILRLTARDRLQELTNDVRVCEIEDPIFVDSVNSEACRTVLRQAAPDVVVVNGTRIIAKETLGCVEARFINMHAGITPLYRGVHGGYWALAEDKPHLVGTTVHFVDTGIDTGGIIGQAFFDIDSRDNFATYPYLHTRTGIPVLLEAVNCTLEGIAKSQEHSPTAPSKLRHHPSIWVYLFHRLRKGVK